MPEVLRLFVAIDLPETVRAEIGALAEPVDGIRWVPSDNLHLTLRFIGDADADRRGRIEAALAGVRVEPFILPVAGVGVFPPRGNATVLWVGLGHAHPRLFQLRKQVDDALLSVDTALDVRNFQPHFTVARIDRSADPRALARLLNRHRDFEAPPFRVAAFHLKSSTLVPGMPPVYRAERTFALPEPGLRHQA